MSGDANLNLNDSPVLPDGTASANAGGSIAEVPGTDAASLKRGFASDACERTPNWDPQITGENTVGDPATFGGVCGRPQGMAR